MTFLQGTTMSKSAILYRMATDEHICPFGLKSKDLLKREGYEVEDHLLTDREQTDAFKEKHDVKTTPQTFIDDKRIGGYDELRDFFNLPKAGQQGKSYTPVLAIFAVTLLLSCGLSYASGDTLLSMQNLMLFIALSMAVLAIQKLQDLYRFSNSFITYDLLAMRVVPYAYVYPFIEAYVAVGMVTELPAYVVAPFALFIGLIGAVSVFKAVYIDKRELKCACVGGDSNVPLGFISLTENIFMIAAGFWVLLS